jgi:hypothetical protein
MQKLIGENPQETLTNQLWNQWKSYGYTSQPRALTWMELNHLVEYFLKVCREKEIDYREYDFSTLIDHKLNYEENKSILFDTIGNPYSEEEKEAANKLKDYFTEEEMKTYTPQQKTVIDDLTAKHETLNKKVNNLTKKMDSQTQTIDPEALKHELDEMQRTQTQIYARLQNIPDMEHKISALLNSQSFKEIGHALEPIAPKVTATEIKPQPRNQFTLKNWLRNKHYKPLDICAGAFTFIIWLAASGWIIQAFNLTFASAIGLAVFWLSFIVVFRLMIGGILD